MERRAAVLFTAILSVALTGLLVVFYSSRTNYEGASISSGSSGMPVGLMIARAMSNTTEVDVVRWDGSDWQQVVAPSTLAPVVEGVWTFAPHSIIELYPDSTTTHIGLWVMYCTVPRVPDTEDCIPYTFVYDTSTSAATQIEFDDFIAPIGWLDNGVSLLLLDVLGGFGLIYNALTTEISEIGAPIEMDEFASGPYAIHRASRRVLVSGSAGDGVVNVDTGASTWFTALGVGPHLSSSMSFSPDGTRAVVSRVRSGQDNQLGAGVMNIFDTTSGALLQSITNSDDWMDFAPVWDEVQGRILFLRADARVFDSDPNPDSISMSTSVQSFDIATGVTTELLPADRARHSLQIANDGVPVFIGEVSGSGIHTVFMIDAAGIEVPVLVDGLSHTSLSLSSN